MKQEWQALLHNRWLKIVLVAIIVIPSLYAGVFLGSMWDPYGNTKDLPVAVVNRDREVMFQQKEIHIGDTLLQSLKKNTSMNFQEADDQTAHKGLEDGQFYMVITIPEHFSKNATTLLDKQPKKMELQYKTNPGMNYIATKMNDSAMLKLKDQVATTVTRLYAETVFSQIHSISDGLNHASLGSHTLNNGIKDARNGSLAMANNLYLLNDRTLALADGSTTLTTGLQDYTSGVNRIAKGSDALYLGLDQLQTGSQSLSSSIPQLTNGGQVVNNGISSYTSAVQSINDHTQTLIENNTALNSGVKQVSSGTMALYTNSSNVLHGVTTISDHMKHTLDSNREQIIKLQLGNQSGSDQIDLLSKDAAALKSSVEQFQQDQKDTLDALKSIKPEDEASRQIVNRLITQCEAVDYQPLLNNLTTFAQSSTTLIALLQGDYQAIQSLHESMLHLQRSFDANGVNANTMGIVQGMTLLNEGLHSLNDHMQLELTPGIKAYTDGTTALAQGTQALNSNSNRIITGTDQLNQGLILLDQRIPQFTNGINQVVQGSSSLKSGTQLLANQNVTILQGVQALQNGTQQLNNGTAQLARGAETLDNGLIDLKKGSGTLYQALARGSTQSQLTLNDKTVDMMSSPVNVNHTQINDVENNGHAMAPYMMSVGLYVACMAFTLMYPLLKKNVQSTSGLQMWFSKATIMYIVSTVMAVCMITLLMIVNGTAPASIAATYVMAILIAAAFMAMIVFLSILFGKVGSFLALIFMVFQLGGAAGTYPIETSSGFYQIIHPFMPFTYSVDAFRHTLAMGDLIMNDIIVFAVMIFVFSLCSIGFYKWKLSISERQYQSTLLSKLQA